MPAKVNFLDTPISEDSAKNILGILGDIPLSVEQMISNLRVTSFINQGVSERLTDFHEKLVTAFVSIGITMVEYDDSLDDSGKIKKDTSVLYPIVQNAQDIAIDHVSSLYRNPIVGIFDMDSPVDDHDTNQKKLDTIIRYLTEEIVHTAIFLSEDSFTVCTMNGAVLKYPLHFDFRTAVRESLVSKLTAQVVPPEILSKFQFRNETFNVETDDHLEIVDDIQKTAQYLKDNGLFMSHLKVDSINFRSKFHKRLAQSYLDERTGMSYGFLVWQLPQNVIQAKEVSGDSKINAGDLIITLGTKKYMVTIPEVSVISTRSGCDKTDLDISKDIVRMSLLNGQIIFDTPSGIDSKSDCNPSYDSLTILSHAIGNYICASILKSFAPNNSFTKALEENGLSLFHWHGYPLQRQTPFGFFFHGQNNPAVSCSTAQSAVYTLYGKLEALKSSMSTEVEYLGDVHIEPHHGSNISSIYRLNEVIKYIIDHD